MKYGKTHAISEKNQEIFENYINGNRFYTARRIKSMSKLQLALLFEQYEQEPAFLQFVIRVLQREIYDV